MDYFFEGIITVYNFIAAIALLISPILVEKENKEMEKNNSKKIHVTWTQGFHILMTLLVVIVSIILLFRFMQMKVVWILGPITTLVFLERTNAAYASLSVIRETINIKEAGLLTKREKEAIVILAASLMSFNAYKFPQNIINFFRNIPYHIISDWVTTILLIMFVTLYCFLIGVLIQIPIKVTKKQILKITRRIASGKIENAMNKYKSFISSIIFYKFFSISFVEWTLQRSKKARILWVLLVLMIPFDVCVKIICACISFLLIILIYCYYILQRVFKSVILFDRYLSQFTDRKMINIIFRSAFVLSISIVMIVNDYFATGDPDRNLVPIH